MVKTRIIDKCKVSVSTKGGQVDLGIDFPRDGMSSARYESLFMDPEDARHLAQFLNDAADKVG